jgi:hypothetical protein
VRCLSLLLASSAVMFPRASSIPSIHRFHCLPFGLVFSFFLLMTLCVMRGSVDSKLRDQQPNYFTDLYLAYYFETVNGVELTSVHKFHRLRLSLY